MEQLFTAYPDLSSFIIDAEIVAVDVETGALKSFQDLSQRARKDVRLEDVKVAVCLFIYDLMYLNGKVSVMCGRVDTITSASTYLDTVRDVLSSAKGPSSYAFPACHTGQCCNCPPRTCREL